VHRMSKALGPLVTPRSRRRTIAVLAIALALFTGLLIARLLNSDESNGLLGLQVIPIALVALELGMLPGFAFAVAALSSVAIWSVTKDVHISAPEYLLASLIGQAVRLALREELAVPDDRCQGRAQLVRDEDRRIRPWPAPPPARRGGAARSCRSDRGSLTALANWGASSPTPVTGIRSRPCAGLGTGTAPAQSDRSYGRHTDLHPPLPERGPFRREWRGAGIGEG
jgi:hypothetical protein